MFGRDCDPVGFLSNSQDSWGKSEQLKPETPSQAVYLRNSIRNAYDSSYIVDRNNLVQVMNSEYKQKIYIHIYIYIYVPQNNPKFYGIFYCLCLQWLLHHWRVRSQVTNFNARRRLMEMLDVDGTATISYPEFIAAMTVPW